MVPRRTPAAGVAFGRRRLPGTMEPAPDAGTVRVEPLTLRHRIEDAKMRRAVPAASYNPLPVYMPRPASDCADFARSIITFLRPRPVICCFWDTYPAKSGEDKSERRNRRAVCRVVVYVFPL